MIFVNIHEAKTHFSKIINQTLQGEEIVVSRGNHPLVKLVPYHEEPKVRKGGQLRGMLRVSDDFDDPLSEEYIKRFYGNEKS